MICPNICNKYEVDFSVWISWGSTLHHGYMKIDQQHSTVGAIALRFDPLLMLPFHILPHHTTSRRNMDLIKVFFEHMGSVRVESL